MEEERARWEGDEALGFGREIYWLNGQAEVWLDRIGRAITMPEHVDRLALAIAALEDIGREANAKACLVAANRAAKIKTDLGALIAFGLAAL